MPLLKWFSVSWSDVTIADYNHRILLKAVKVFLRS